MVILPHLGSVILDKIFINVDSPAPFRPIMPTRSPRLISKLTSLSAQNSSIVSSYLTYERMVAIDLIPAFIFFTVVFVYILVILTNCPDKDRYY